MILGTVRRKIIANSMVIVLIIASATFYTGPGLFGAGPERRAALPQQPAHGGDPQLPGPDRSQHLGLPDGQEQRLPEGLHPAVHETGGEGAAAEPRDPAGRFAPAPEEPGRAHRQLPPGHRSQRLRQAGTGREELQRAVRELGADGRAGAVPHRPHRGRLHLGFPQGLFGVRLPDRSGAHLQRRARDRGQPRWGSCSSCASPTS